MSDPTMQWSSWCEVDGQALAHNVAEVRRRLKPDTLLGVVVKANAYGHGLALCGRVFADAGVDWLVVHAVEEAVALREAGIRVPVYICSRTPPALADTVVETEARVVIMAEEDARALASAARRAGRTVPVHIKVETGMHRQGLDPSEALALGRWVHESTGLRLEGLTTHLSDSDDTVDAAHTAAQLARLRETAGDFAREGLEIAVLHAANSGATLLWPESHLGLVRLGIAAYGLWPSRECEAVLRERAMGDPAWRAVLKPALTWRSRVAAVKPVPAGGFVGYGRTYRMMESGRVAILPVGYYDGVDRRLSGVGHVLLHGRRAPIRGRVCMNVTIVDVTHIPEVRPGDVATLIGADGDERITAEDWAGWMQSIGYEVVARIRENIPRRLEIPSAEAAPGGQSSSRPEGADHA